MRVFPASRPLAAALALIAGTGCVAAQAQVTMFGLVDVYAGRQTGAPTGLGVADKPLYRVDSGGMSTSHLGWRGSEDLGDGMAAQFELSTFLRADTGAAGRNDAIGPPVNVAADPFFSRSSWVGLVHPKLGRLRAGNITTLLFVNSITSNAFGDSTVFSPLNLALHIGGPNTGGTGWTNQVVWDSPNWSGATLSLARSLSEGLGGGNSSARALYAAGPLSVSAVWQSVKRNPLTFADGTSANNTRTWMVGGSYDFGRLRLYAHLGRVQNQGTEAAPAHVGYRLGELSLAVPLGTGRVVAGYASRQTDDTPSPVPATAAGGNLERRITTLGYDHFVSARTDLYAMLMRDQTSTRVLPAPPTRAEASGTSWGLGVRHRF